MSYWISYMTAKKFKTRESALKHLQKYGRKSDIKAGVTVY